MKVHAPDFVASRRKEPRESAQKANTLVSSASTETFANPVKFDDSGTANETSGSTAGCLTDLPHWKAPSKSPRTSRSCPELGKNSRVRVFASESAVADVTISSSEKASPSEAANTCLVAPDLLQAGATRSDSTSNNSVTNELANLITAAAQSRQSEISVSHILECLSKVRSKMTE